MLSRVARGAFLVAVAVMFTVWAVQLVKSSQAEPVQQNETYTWTI